MYGKSPSQSALEPWRELQKRCADDHAQWLEDILAGLLINGVAKEAIEVQHHDGGLRTVVLVNGVQKYERILTYTSMGSE